MGAFQLPDSVLGDAIACLVYSALCLFANCVLVWLIWTHHERTSYVAFIAYFTLLATTSSIVQQFYDYIFWKDIMTNQFYYGQKTPFDAETQYQNEIYGLKLALSYVRVFAIIVEASLVFFFSMSLAATVYGWWAKKPRAHRTLSILGRAVPIGLAIISVILLQFEFTHRSFIVYMVVANAQYILALLGSCIFLLMILFKYLQSRRQLNTWRTVQYGQGESRSTGTSQSFMKNRQSRPQTASTAPRVNGTFDNWLVVRLTIAFMTLCVFEYTNISPRLRNRQNVLDGIHETGPDLSHKRAFSTVTGYLSGVSPSMLAFLVFGTTKTFQRKMYRTFVPRTVRKWINKGKDDDDNDDLFRCRHPAYYQGSGSAYGSNSYARASGLPFATTANNALDASSGAPRRPPSTPRRPSSHALSAKTSTFSLRGGIPPPLTTTTTNTTTTTMPASAYLGPAREPGRTWLADSTDGLTSSSVASSATGSPTEAATITNIRHSQIGLAIGEPLPAEAASLTPAPLSIPATPLAPPPPAAPILVSSSTSVTSTFLRDGTPDSLDPPSTYIPMSIFNSNTGSSGSSSAAVIAPAATMMGAAAAGGVGGPATSSSLHRQGSVASSTTVIWSEGRGGPGADLLKGGGGGSVPRGSLAGMQRVFRGARAPSRRGRAV